MSNNLTARTVQNFRQLARVNTGAHMLDSGGAYGRHHERDDIPESQPAIYAQDWGDEVYLSVNTAAWLDENAEINRYETERFYRWASKVDPRDEQSWPELLETYVERRWPDEPIKGDNVYNWENPFDQVFQYWIVGDSDYPETVIIQMHNGCDVRGGYTGPVFADITADYVWDVVSPSWQIDSASCRAELAPTPAGQGELIDRGTVYCYAETDNLLGDDDWKIERRESDAVVVCPNGHTVYEYTLAS